MKHVLGTVVELKDLKLPEGHAAPPAGHILGSKCPFLAAGIQQRSSGFVKEASKELQEDVQRIDSPCEGQPSAPVSFDLQEVNMSSVFNI